MQKINCFRQNFLPMMKHELYANNSTIVAVSPLDGVYVISTVPRMKAPPTHVAAGRITTQEIVQSKCS